MENLILYSYLRIFYLVVGYGHNNHFQFPSERSLAGPRASQIINAVAVGSESLETLDSIHGWGNVYDLLLSFDNDFAI